MFDINQVWEERRRSTLGIKKHDWLLQKTMINHY